MRTYAQEWKFFEYLRRRFGVEKPYALEWGGWEKWDAQLKKDRPMAFFLTETIPDIIDDVAYHIPTPIADIRYYCRNRFYRKTHVLPTGFKPGEYHDFDERILHGIMNSLVDYIEVELAYKSRWCKTEESKTAKWKNGRCPELGLAHLAWEMTLDDPALDVTERCDSQAVTAREVKAIYDWWKVTRPARPDPYEASGWSAICDEGRATGSDFMKKGDEDYEARKSEAFKLNRKIEQEYEDEDQEMLIRVIKRRKSLWA
jgi:hypothetical protein